MNKSNKIFLLLIIILLIALVVVTLLYVNMRNTAMDNNIVLENDMPEEQDYRIDTNKITIEVDKNTITPISISIIITNNNENEIGYGEEYKIQKNTNGKWEDLEYLPNTIWNAMAYTTKGNSQTTRKLNLENTYGELNNGTYRVIKSIFMGNGKNIDIYSNEFEVK